MPIGVAVRLGLGDRVGAEYCRSRPACSRSRRSGRASAAGGRRSAAPTMSGVEPGPNGTTILTVLVGHSCAAAAAGMNSAAANATAKVFHRVSRAFQRCDPQVHIQVITATRVVQVRRTGMPTFRRQDKPSADGATALPPALPWPLLPPLRLVPEHGPARRAASEGPWAKC